MTKSKVVVGRRSKRFWSNVSDRECWLALGYSVALSSVGSDLQAQEVTPHASLAGPTAAQLRPPADYDLRYEELRFLVRPSLALEFNDNITWSSSNRRSDFIIEPKLDLGIYWPITEFNALHAAVGISYQVYTDNTEFNNPWPLISPNSALEWNFYTGDFHIQVHDRISYQEDLSLRGLEPQAGAFFNVSDQARFGRVDNQAGFNVDWDLYQLVLALSFDHQNFFMTGAQYSYLNRMSELPAFTLSLRVTDPVRVGVETRSRVTDYNEHVLADRWDVTAGPFVDWTISEQLSLRGGGGYEATDLTEAVAGASDLSTYYAYARLRHRVNWFLSHALSVGRETQDGFNAQYLQDVYVRHTSQWLLLHNFDINTRAGFLFGHEFGGEYSEHFDYYTLGAEIGWRIHDRSRLFVAYDFTQKLSDQKNADYYQNRVRLGFSYQF
jgi:hypothetical protein